VLHEAVVTQNISIESRPVVAEGRSGQIRDLIDNHPHHIVLASRAPATRRAVRQLAGRRSDSHPGGKQTDGGDAGADAFYSRLPRLSSKTAQDSGNLSDDDNLDAVFKYV